MKIGNIDYGNRPLFLAPIEDVTDVGFRMLCKRYDAAIVYTEFIAAEGWKRVYLVMGKNLEIKNLIWAQKLLGRVRI